MRLRVSSPPSAPLEERASAPLPPGALAEVEGARVESSGGGSIILLCPPGQYQEVQRIAKAAGAALDVVKLAVVDDGERAVGEAAGSLESAELKADAPPERDWVPPPQPVKKEIAAPPEPPAGSDEETEDERLLNMSTKDRKKAQRKSKKTARRAKEKEEELKAKVDKERQRVKEREERLAAARGDGGGKADAAAPAAAAPDAGGKGKACTTCGGSFSAGEFRAHFKSDWHRYNLKLKGMGAAVVGEDEFRAVDSDALFLE
jgi:ribosome maturation protein SDO1